MPVLNGQAYEPAKVACEVHRTDQVLLIRFTGEAFPEYECVFARIPVPWILTANYMHDEACIERCSAVGVRCELR